MPTLRMFIRGLCAFAPKPNDKEMTVFLVNCVRPQIHGIRPHQAQLAYRNSDWVSQESDDQNRVHFLGTEWNCWLLNFEHIGFETFDNGRGEWLHLKPDSLTIARGSRKPKSGNKLLILPDPKKRADFDWVPKMAIVHDPVNGSAKDGLFKDSTNNAEAIARLKLTEGSIRMIGFVPEFADGKIHPYQFVDSQGSVREKMALTELACLEINFADKIRIYAKELNGSNRLNYVTLAPKDKKTVTICLENRPMGPPNGTTTQSRDTSTFLMTYELCNAPPAVEDRPFPLSTTDEPKHYESPPLQAPARFMNTALGIGESKQSIGKDPESCPFVELPAHQNA
jgi:hypothetical protein